MDEEKLERLRQNAHTMTRLGEHRPLEHIPAVGEGVWQRVYERFYGRKHP
jgi:hypothetical protein